MMVLSAHPTNPRRAAPAFTLLESLIAATILAAMVLATSMALSGGRRLSLEAQERMQGTLAAEALLAEILAVDYAAMTAYDGHDEAPGSLKTTSGDAYPAAHYRIGRRATVTPGQHEFEGLGLIIEGLDIRVEAYDDFGNVVVALDRFIPEPPPES